jgi:hypothetical protein
MEQFLPGKLRVPLLAKEFSAFYETRRFMTTFTITQIKFLTKTQQSNSIET